MRYNLKDCPSDWMPTVFPTACNATMPELLAGLLSIKPEQAEAVLGKLTCGTGAISPLRDVTLVELQQHLSPVRAVKLAAAIELGRRLFAVPTQSQVIDSPENAAAAMAYHLGFQSVEKACLLVLDIKHRLLHTQVFSIGTVSECLLQPRDVFRIVLRLNGARCIIGHNHPSAIDTTGTQPSADDIKMTQQLLQAGQVMNIPVLDHIVIGQNCHTSMRQVTDLWMQYSQQE